MHFEVIHITRFEYSKAVFLEPHIVRLRPRCDPTQRLNSFKVSIKPGFSGLSEYIELDGNSAAHLWFNDKTDYLEIKTSSQVETLLSDPFNYLIVPDCVLKLPFQYPSEIRLALEPYLTSFDLSKEVTAFAYDIAQETRGETIPFLNTLTSHIYRHFQTIIREEGDPLPSEMTLLNKQGACRDLAVLFIDACRAMEIAARFVSGYQEGDENQHERYLHAWAEVYLPGAGWRGYDPSHGLVVSDRHIAVAAGHTFKGAAPITGSFRGTGVQSTLRSDIKIKVMHYPVDV